MEAHKHAAGLQAHVTLSVFSLLHCCKQTCAQLYGDGGPQAGPVRLTTAQLEFTFLALSLLSASLCKQSCLLG